MTREAGEFDLSIVIPTRNRPHGLKLAVESALQQSGRNVEVIVVDDGSERGALRSKRPMDQFSG